MRPERDWSGLLPEMLEQIATRIRVVEDFMAFRGVCTCWRSAVTKGQFLNSSPNTTPLLMLPEEKKIVMRLTVPKAKDKWCMRARFGWLLTVDFYAATAEADLLNPISGAKMTLPSIDTFPDYVGSEYIRNANKPFITKAVLSADPSRTSDFVLMVVHTFGDFFGFWRSRDSSWSKIESPPGCVYLVESSSGELLALIPSDSVTHLRVVRLDVTRGTSEISATLGEDAVFVGCGAVFSVLASAFPFRV
ncbi:OLC1v1030187C1 [Oldenlandia corymbosa var. corymbosa]|uniref:OLC1v1030187C1 n=1 Tax=Oldenlandia corymbosa var. corymbosa TaxID=529605 RepID=A0AAV1CH08_OLDCO|nr:OLC1v1030187C1 [Oldenlandia corymbosa var. corymbosa]